MECRKTTTTILLIIIIISATITFYLKENFFTFPTGDLKLLLPSKFGQNLDISKKLENSLENFGNSKVIERFFEDRCLTEFKMSQSFDNKTFEFLETEEGKKYKKIFAYYHAYGRNFYFGSGHKPFEEACCKEKRCFITKEKNKIPIEKFDAVLIHFRDFKKNTLPKIRERHQRYVFYERESPPSSSKNPEDFEGVFNWTMTYRRDSDIVLSYGQVFKKNSFKVKDFRNFERNSSSLENVMKTKKKLVAWMVSNCKTPSRRSEYVSKLKKYIPVDIYGGCGDLKCSRDHNTECYSNIERKYKFYLSFENNLCKDYVTEKFFNILSFYIVPVVRGSADYATIGPPNSYINVKDFKSPKELADYLIYLDKNDTAYMEYFTWKKDYFVMGALSSVYHATRFCSLCMKLHNDNEEKIYYNLKEWFLESAECNKGL